MEIRPLAALLTSQLALHHSSPAVMGLHSIAVPATAVLLASVSGTPAVTTSKMTGSNFPVPSRSLTENQPNVRAMRFLRTDFRVDADNEERVIPTSSLEKFKVFMAASTTPQRTIDRWLQKRKSMTKSLSCCISILLEITCSTTRSSLLGSNTWKNLTRTTTNSPRHTRCHYR